MLEIFFEITFLRKGIKMKMLHESLHFFFSLGQNIYTNEHHNSCNIGIVSKDPIFNIFYDKHLEYTMYIFYNLLV